MRRPTLYSGSRHSPLVNASALPPTTSPSSASPAETVSESSARSTTLAAIWRQRVVRWHWAFAWLAIAVLGGALIYALNRPLPPPLTQKDFDRAVLTTASTHVLPSQDARAFQAIIPSVVRVASFNKVVAPKGKTGAGKQARAKSKSADKNSSPPKTPQAPQAQEEEKAGEQQVDLIPPGYEPRGIGTGVVIVDDGTILTNLHVVRGADLIELTFMDGTQSLASVSGVQAKDDLAVLRARTVPDDLHAATLTSTAGLAPGEHVMAVGFPFGIGPSASSGIVSGLKRSIESPQSEQMMSNLIQFDAAANPGNSGGPLINMAGEVLGIVTAIYNPNQQGSFVGIGFAVPIENAASAAGMSPF